MRNIFNYIKINYFRLLHNNIGMGFLQISKDWMGCEVFFNDFVNKKISNAGPFQNTSKYFKLLGLARCENNNN